MEDGSASPRAGSPTSAMPMAMYSPNLSSQWDTLVGGIYISRPGGGTCTLGIVGGWAGLTVAVTASHCSSQGYQLDSSPLYQAVSPRQVGTEYVDPPGAGLLWLVAM